MPLDYDRLYRELTDNIVAALEDPNRPRAPWHKPFGTTSTGLSADAPRNLQSGKPYRGINMLITGLAGYSDPRWTTAKAAFKQGGKIREGELSTVVTFWDKRKVRITDSSDPNYPGVKFIPFLKYYRVFNAEQINWAKPLPALKADIVDEQPQGWTAHDEAERVLQEYIDRDSELSIRWGGSRACYDPASHRITLPDRESFKSQGGFYGVAFHEAAHSTAPTVKRQLSTNFGSAPYAREELVAEIASGFMCAITGVDGDFDNSLAYLQSWADAIKNDPKMFVKAAGKAQEAADCIQGIVWAKDEQPLDNAVAA